MPQTGGVAQADIHESTLNRVKFDTSSGIGCSITCLILNKILIWMYTAFTSNKGSFWNVPIYIAVSSNIHTFEKVFYQLFRLCCIAVALPVSSASCERSFSALKLIKTHLRTTMTDDRLSNLGVLSIEVRRAKCLDLDDLLDGLPVTTETEDPAVLVEVCLLSFSTVFLSVCYCFYCF